MLFDRIDAFVRASHPMKFGHYYHFVVQVFRSHKTRIEHNARHESTHYSIINSIIIYWFQKN
jgi:hypothetical protein